MFAKGISTVVSEAKKKISDVDILSYYLGITKIPTRISSPLRQDTKPSFGLFSFDGKKIFYKDFATQDSGSTLTLFQKLWGLSYNDTWTKIVTEMTTGTTVDIAQSNIKSQIDKLSKVRTIIQVATRDWKQYDLDYWKQYGITKDWLVYADVHPISDIIFEKETGTTIVHADKLAYTFAEFKEGKTTLKIYQPLNKNGFKWLNNHDGSVISLWTKVPPTGDKICICSSVKDALCLWANTGIPAISPQGEGYSFSEHAINDLKQRFKHVYILYDNDPPGLLDGEKLQTLTNFTNIILPPFEGGKDVSDYYKILNNKQLFCTNILKLFQL